MSKDVTVHVGIDFDAAAKRVADVWHRAERGEAIAGESHVTFESWEALTSVLTAKRLELLRHLRRRPEANIAALARSLGRDYKRVHEDVEALRSAGLIDHGEQGLVAGYHTLKAEIAL